MMIKKGPAISHRPPEKARAVKAGIDSLLDETIMDLHPGIGINSSARFSACRAYRYTLTRVWSMDGPALIVIGLNPSTADASIDDPTIRRCVGFAKREGFGGLLMLNLFALRATDPKAMLAHQEPVGDHNDRIIEIMASGEMPTGETVLAAWGTHGKHLDRDREVMELLGDETEILCLGTNSDGSPKHPLYLAADTPLTPYTGRPKEPAS